ncbi:MAG: hypothetical protein OXH56_00145 [Gemmatimonadetes bacterium]|nr:hypothetical protein [Gemmatimonadota bacterium]
MSSKFRKYVEDRLAALEEEAALLRNALDVLTDFEREDEFFAAARSVSKDDAGVQDSTGSNVKDPEADVTAKATRKATTREKPAVKKTCSKRGCTNVVVAKGLCRKHYDKANPRSSRSKKKEEAASDSASTAAEGADPDPPAADKKLPRNRVPCGHPHCDASVPFTGGIPDEPMYCSDFCRNNHARILAETAAN